MAHDHAHDHSHAVSPAADRKWLTVALAMVLGFMAVEIVAGVVADSLALLSDAAHMLTDAGAIGLALVAARLAARPPKGRFTFGLGRAEILSAQLNGALLLLLAGVIAWEAGKRIYEPPDVEGVWVLTVGIAGAAANVLAAAALARAQRQSLNVAGARAHVLADLYASIAAAVSGGLILLTDVRELDGVAALVVAALMVASGWRLLRDASAVLLEGAPAGVDPDRIGRTLASQPGIVEVHDLHVWEVTSGFPAVAAHVIVEPGEDCHQRRRDLQRVLDDTFGVAHTTLQVDHAAAPDQLLTIERPAR
ncbi:MAG: cation diffusion facilitator family transporter [Actinomycetota bacterium]|nr:cation diffusion facilitator family transporter [Actinomycetota bacterium]MDQ5808484.1 cation diffusion facilitator family transporter [Actinomycetota bacterium]